MWRQALGSADIRQQAHPCPLYWPTEPELPEGKGKVPALTHERSRLNKYIWQTILFPGEKELPSVSPPPPRIKMVELPGRASYSFGKERSRERCVEVSIWLVKQGRLHVVHSSLS